MRGYKLNFIYLGGVLKESETLLLPVPPTPPPPESDTDESLSTSVSILYTDWNDIRYTVHFDTGVQGSIVEFNNESKTTNSSGVATFLEVLPVPNVDKYSYKVTHNEEVTTGVVTITGYDEIKEITIPIQLGLSLDPFSIEDEAITSSVRVLDTDWNDIRYTVHFDTGVQGSVIHFNDQTATTNSLGIATFYNVLPVPNVESYGVLVQTPYYEDLNVVVTITGHDDTKEITIPLQLGLPLNSLEVIPEDFSTTVKVLDTDWNDIRYTVNFDTGVQGSVVEFNDEVETTNIDGIATFYNVLPMPNVSKYDYKITNNEEVTVGVVTITGHDVSKEVTIVIQLGLPTYPHLEEDTLMSSVRVLDTIWEVV